MYKLSGLHVAARHVGRPRIHNGRTNRTKRKKETEKSQVHADSSLETAVTFRGKLVRGGTFSSLDFPRYIVLPALENPALCKLSFPTSLSLSPSVRSFVASTVDRTLRPVRSQRTRMIRHVTYECVRRHKREKREKITNTKGMVPQASV